MRHICLVSCGIAATLLVGCGANSDDSMGARSTSDAIEVSLAVDRNPDLMETCTLTCGYEVDYPILPVGRDDYIVEGHFELPNTHFTILSGDSSWVDTVKVNTPRVHSVVVQAIKRGDWLVDALTSSVIEEGVSVIGGGDSIELHVK